MKEYDGKVVAITGAAHGIGRELAIQLAGKGAKFALADIQGDPLLELAEQLKDKGAEVITSCFDVRNFADMQGFANKTYDTYGSVDYVFNNAGISAVGTAWKMPLNDWDWLIDVNLKGPMHGMRAFIPKMIDSGKECYFVTTASAAGLVTLWGGAGYAASKHAVIGMAETLELDLRRAGSKVKTYVICPSFVISNLHNSMEYRSKDEWEPNDPFYQDPDYIEADKRSRYSTGEAGMSTDEAVRNILKELDEDKFVILTHPHVVKLVETRYHRLLAGRRPGVE
jgi:NADP-dependent 3-hydroxy acid dehydrogenase YdfG